MVNRSGYMVFPDIACPSGVKFTGGDDQPGHCGLLECFTHHLRLADGVVDVFGADTHHALAGHSVEFENPQRFLIPWAAALVAVGLDLAQYLFFRLPLITMESTTMLR